MYCVAITLKMTEQVERKKSASNSVLSLNILLQKLFGWFRRLQLWATGDWQLHHNNVPTHASCLVQFFCETSNHPGDSAHTSHIWHPANSGFSQNSNYLWKGRDFRLWDSGKYGDLMGHHQTWWGTWWQLGELCEVPRCLLWRELRCPCPIYNASCILYLL